MKERPILFSGEMVRAILDGRKTQTRRVVKPQPLRPDDAHLWKIYSSTCKKEEGKFRWGGPENNGGREWQDKELFQCPYGFIGDQLWVREAYAELRDSMGEMQVYYRATEDAEIVLEDGDGYAVYNKNGTLKSPWKSPRFMPRRLSRILLEITDIRVERVQEITAEDARAEGINVPAVGIGGSPCECALGEFQKLWDFINAKRGYGWDVNPWVWVVSFKRVMDGEVSHG